MRNFCLAATSALILAACGAPSDTGVSNTDADSDAGEINIYSSRHYDTDLALYEDFTEETGIKVNRIEADADALIERITNEGEFSPADLLITVDAGRLWRAEQADIFAPVESETLASRLPENLRHPDNLWFGLSTRARVIIYNKADGKPEPLETYADLADPTHEGKVCIRSSSNIYNISLMASLISREGVEAAKTWAEGVVANFARDPQSNDTGQIEAVASGECGIALVNTYYLARLAASDDPAQRAIFDAVGVVFANQETTGTHVNISGAGLVKNAPNRENAIRFLEYLTDEAAQSYLANGNHEYPAVPGIAPTAAVMELGEFVADDLNTSELGVQQTEAVKVFDRAGWK